MLILLSFGFFESFAVKTYNPSFTAPPTVSGGAGYCVGATATAIVCSYSTCTSGAVPLGPLLTDTVKWYRNNTSSTTGGTLVSSTVNTCVQAATGTYTYVPSTATVGVFYYYCVIKWATASGTCNASGVSTSTNTTTITVQPPSTPISGSNFVCTGLNITLTDTTAGGTWSSSATGVATINGSGLVHGVAGGTTTISYNTGCGTPAMFTLHVNASSPAITGATSVCTGSDTVSLDTTRLHDATGGGAWSCSNTAKATVGSSTGLITGVDTGNIIISYVTSFSVGTCTVTKNLTVIHPPYPVITGPTSFCFGDLVTMTGSGYYSGSGAWSSADPSIAFIDGSGDDFGNGAGTTTIYYATTNVCGTTTASYPVTVNPLAFADTIGGIRTICPGATTLLTNSTSGGTWTTDDPTIATIDGSGLVTGVAVGTTTISYFVTTASCGSDYNYATVTVGGVSAGSISGLTSVNTGDTLHLSDIATGGTWGSSNNLIAIVDTSGIVTGIAPGSDTISYTVVSSCGSATATQAINVTGTSAGISGPSTVCTGSIITLTAFLTGGTWSTGNPSTATVDGSGGVTGVSQGIVAISYSITDTSGTTVFTKAVTVNPYGGVITGPSSVVPGGSVTLTDTLAGGTWASSDTSSASVDATGIVTATGSGSVVISYSISTGCGTAIATKHLTIGYCIPNHDSARASCVDGRALTRFEIIGETGSQINDHGAIDSTSTYENHAGTLSVNLKQNSTYNAYLASGGASLAGRVWIDFNDDDYFDSSESVGSLAGFGSSLTVFTVAIPSRGDTGTHRMRVVGSYGNGLYGGGAYPNLDPCAVSAFGDVRDYSVHIAPYFSFDSGAAQHFNICANTLYDSIDTILGVYYETSGISVTWSVNASPYHGTLHGFNYTGTTTGGNLLPVGLSYTPVSGYVGDDVFSVKVRYGTQSLITTVNVRVGTNSITGSSIVDTGSTILLHNADAGGVWSTPDTTIARVDPATGLVSGRAVGTATISYTVYDSICGTISATAQIAVINTPCTPYFTHAPASCTSGDAISSFHMNGELGTSYAVGGTPGTPINDLSHCNGTTDYEDNTSFTPVIFNLNDAYGMTSTTGAEGYGSAQVWIDFSNNGIFETSESVGGFRYGYSSGYASDSIYIPATVDTGAHLMRVVLNFPGSDTSGRGYPNIDPCASGVAYGDSRQYWCTIRNLNHIPRPSGGNIKAFSVCTGAAAIGLDSMLTITDKDTGQLINWTVITPGNGTFSGFSLTDTSNGGYVVPHGLTYAPNPGFTGYDTFVVQVSDGYASINITVMVHVGPPDPGNISTTYSTLYPGWNEYMFDYNSHPGFSSGGGVWSSSDNSVATINTTYGILTAVAAGTCVITYTVTNSCGTTFTTYGITVINPVLCTTCTGTGSGGGGCCGSSWTGTGGGCTDNPPLFQTGYVQNILFSEDTNTINLDNYLIVSDPDLGQTETWTVSSPPLHGTLNGFPYTAASDIFLFPSGLSYTPAPGFHSHDQFSITVSDGVCYSSSITINIDNDNIYLKGKYVQMGIGPNGSFISTLDAPTAYTTNSDNLALYDPSFCVLDTSDRKIGMIYDYGHDGWNVGIPSFYGDYSTAGVPQEGWSAQVGARTSDAFSANYRTACSGYTGYMHGSNLSYTSAAGVSEAVWQGIMDSAFLAISHTTRLDTNASWVTVTTVLRNTSAAPIGPVYFNRTIDPDNDNSTSGLYTTNNTISSAPVMSTHNNVLMASSTGTVNTNAFLSLGTRDTRAKAYIMDSGLVTTDNLASVWNGASTYHMSGAATGDIAMGLVFNIGTLAAGDSAVITYAYIFNGNTGIDSALPGAKLSVAGGLYETSDTVNSCSGSMGSILAVSIVNGSERTWNWLPVHGLDSAGGMTNRVHLDSVTGTVVYTITGTNPHGWDTTKRVFYLVVNSTLGTTSISGPGTICGGSSVSLTDSVSGGTWRSSDTTLARVNAATGVVTGEGGGIVSIYYTLVNACGSHNDTFALNVHPEPAAHITSAVNPCVGYATNIIFSGAAGDTIVYNMDGGTNVSSVLTGGTFSLNTGALTYSHTFTLVNAHDALCGTTVIDTTITLAPTPMQWIGGTAGSETDWNNAANWSCGLVPGVNDLVTIPNGTVFFPAITASVTNSIKSLVLDSGVVITLNAASVLNISDTFSNNGVIKGGGTVVLNGSTNQQHAKGHGYVQTLEMNSNPGAIIDSGNRLTVTGTLTVTGGTLITNDSLVIYSDSTATARIAPLPATGAGITGNVKIMQYIPGGYRRWRFISHPFSNAISLAQIANYIDITGVGGSANGFTTTGSNSPSAFRYNPALGNSSLSYDPGWQAFTSTDTVADSNQFHQYQGIRLFIRGAKGEGLGYGSYVPSATNISMWGHVNQGTQTVHMIKGTGSNQDYNLLSNPYPSPVNLGAVLHRAKVSGNIAGAAFYVWNPYISSAGNFQAIPVNTVTALPFYLQSDGAFEVRATNNNDSLVFLEDDKSANVSTMLLRSIPQYVSLAVYSTDYHLWDMLYVNFNADGTDKEDNDLDARKLSGPDFNFYSFSADNMKLAIDSRPYAAGKVIPLGIRSNYAQDFIIRAENMVLPEDGKLYLHDKLSGQYTLLQQGTEYRFSIAADDNTQGDARFELTAGTPLVADNTSLDMTILPNPANEEVNINFKSGTNEQVNLNLVDMTGLNIFSKTITGRVNGSINVSVDGLSPGIYLVELSSGDQKVVRKLVKE